MTCGVLPNAVVCGAQKSGTTTLFDYMVAHPEIHTASEKEVNFFTLHYDRGVDWYRQKFSGYCGQPVICEATPVYMFDPEVPRRMLSVLGSELKLIFMLRDPISRAYSNYWYNVSRGAQKPSVSFEAAVETPEGRERYIRKGYYFSHLSVFRQYFAADQIFVCYFEDLREDRDRVLTNLWDFLGVSNCRGLPNIRSNRTAVPRSSAAGTAFHGLHKLWRVAKSVLPKQVVAKTTALRGRVNSFVLVGSPPSHMDEACQVKLQDLFLVDASCLHREYGAPRNGWEWSRKQ